MSERARHTIRVALVALLSAWGLVVIVPDVTRLWAPLGTLGFQADNDGVITSVDDGGPASKAGIREGDRIDIRATNFEGRRTVGGLIFVRLGHPFELHVVRRHGAHVVAVVPEPEELGLADKLTLFFDEIFGVLFIGIGAALVLLRPSRMTWGFFLYSVWFNPGQFFAFYAWLPAQALATQEILQAIMQSLGYVGFLVFALRFPHDRVSGWRAACEYLLPVLFIALAVPSAYSFWTAFGYQTEMVYRFSYALGLCVYALVVLALIGTYLQHQLADRQRIKWVIFGCLIGLPTFLFADTNEATSFWDPFWNYVNAHWPAIPTSPPEWFLHLLYMVSVSVPLTIAYAVIRHRVIDVRFVVNRGLVLASTGLIIAASLEFIHWLLDEVMHESGVGAVVLPLAAVASGLGFAWLHRRVGHLIDLVFFPHWHRAEHHLSDVRDRLLEATSEDEVGQLLLDEPIEAFRLEAGALYVASPDGVLRRRSAVTWPPEALDEFEPEDPLVAAARAARRPIKVRDEYWQEEHDRRLAMHPAVAAPVLLRERIVALALYGYHTSGEDINPDEMRLIGRLAHAASAAYHFLETEALRRELADLRMRSTPRAALP